ncbi:Tn7 transposase DNA-binding protein TnsC [Syntrophotalea carbinolica DSM 2380]|uniref:Tn7 transposase DNA-binding protein TnsC n=1 Tax=Syntrophotalea carbinolica (strain DSM 2380 / NBRC 103641 / GraBd1) TaxID=338963 RepID=Q3A0E2_SYNC1|nr:ATP-binding protein [Syntrophotalea carbinolica]ABA90165.1 Tn7 transposase DNA-binding protein TnsC [Syntrophotalea carbinolica DSM 2380]
MIKLPVAQYIEAEIKEYSGHPLINALPPINSPQDTARMLNRYPVVAEAEKNLPGHIRRHAMMRILDQFLYPTKSHLQLEQMISGMLRRGYLSRNIADRCYQRNLDVASGTDFQVVARNAGNEALVSSVIGCSGTGKSTAVEAILKGYWQAIYHPEYQHTQLVWLKVECPHDGSVRNLCTNFFRAVDDALGTDYQQLYVKARSSAESMLGDIARVAALHSVGLLVIDEIQHLEKSRSGGSGKMLNFFVTLANVIKVPVLFIGTPKALELFLPTMRSARRAVQFGSLNWSRFVRAESGDGPDGEWERFIKRMWKLQWFKSPTPLTCPMSDLFWEYTQGIAHIAVALFYLCQARAVMAGREVIDRSLVTKVYNEELSIIHPMINALRSGRKEKILQYADLDLPTESIRMLGSHAPDIPMPEATEKKVPETKLARLIDLLEQMGLGQDIAPVVAEQAIEEKPDEDLFGLVSHVRNLQEKTEPRTEPAKPVRQKAAPLKPVYLDNDLRLMRDDDPQVSYQNFKRSGVIIDLTAYL